MLPELWKSFKRFFDNLEKLWKNTKKSYENV